MCCHHKSVDGLDKQSRFNSTCGAIMLVALERVKSTWRHGQPKILLVHNQNLTILLQDANHGIRCLIHACTYKQSARAKFAA